MLLWSIQITPSLEACLWPLSSGRVTVSNRTWRHLIHVSMLLYLFFLDGKYRVTFPDPGEYERAMVEEDKVIFSMPLNKLDDYVDALKQLDKMGLGYARA